MAGSNSSTCSTSMTVFVSLLMRNMVILEVAA
jgi:hypothetical protein